MRRFCAFLAVLLLIACPLFAFAHSGGTDSMGGHYDNSTGQYHFHHGKSAHQHIGGRCPYDKSGRTDWPTAKPSRSTQTAKPSSSASAAKRYAIATTRPTAIPKHESEGSGTLRSVGLVGGGAAVGGVGVSLFRKRRGKNNTLC